MTSQPKTLTAGVVGCGVVASWAHLPALKAIPELELRAVCDADLERARKAGSDFGVSAVYGDLTSMLDNEAIDVVHVLTNPESHLELTLQAMEAGSNVLIEKPFVYTTAEADRAIEKGKETGTRFSVIHNDVFAPGIIELKERIAAEEIGTITSVQFFSAMRDQRGVSRPWYYTTYGGRMGETLPHALCLLVDLVDEFEVTHVDARTLGHSIAPDEVDERNKRVDELNVQLFSKRANTVGKISYGFNSNLPDTLMVSGTEGHLIAHVAVVDHVAGGLTRLPVRAAGASDAMMVARDVANKVLAKLRLRRPPRRQLNHYRQIRAYALHLRDGKPYSVSESKAREVVVLWETIVKTYSS